MPRRTAQHDVDSVQRVIARLARVVAAETPCADYADFKHALRCRLAQLHVRYQPLDFDEAITVVTSNTRLWGARPAPRGLHDASPVDGGDSRNDLSPAEAAAFLAQLHHRVRTMPRPRVVTAHHRDQAASLRLVLDQLRTQMAVVDALDRETP